MAHDHTINIASCADCGHPEPAHWHRGLCGVFNIYTGHKCVCRAFRLAVPPYTAKQFISDVAAGVVVAAVLMLIVFLWISATP